MKILITGNLGYVGPAVIRELRSSIPGAVLIGCDPGWFAARVSTPNRLPETLLDAQIYKDSGELTDLELKGFDVVVQLAAVSNDPMGQTYEAATEEINHRTAVKIAERAKSAGVPHFIFASSASVYGIAAEICSELSPVNPQTAYARSKVATELELSTLADDRFMVTCMRFSTACGWSDRIRLDLVLNDFVSGALIDGEIRLISDGSPLRPLIATTDMARAVTGAALGSFEANRLPFEAINIGSDEWNFTIGELARLVGQRLGNLPVVLGEKGGTDTRSYALDFSKFGQLLPKWQPIADIEAVIDELAVNLKPLFDKSSRDVKESFVRLRTLDLYRRNGQLSSDLDWLQP